MADRVTLYDTTLRDGAQTQGVDFSVADKVAIASALDQLGLDYIEGGWPGANPTDDAFFQAAPTCTRAVLTAFGMTRRPGRSASNDPVLGAVLGAGTKAVCLVGKSSAYQVRTALGTEPEENIRMVATSITESIARGKDVLYDAEHFFDGFKADPDYALQCIEAAYQAGARWIVLCDTNGGTLPHEITRIVEAAMARVPGSHLGIHCHNDTEMAVANSIAAVQAGVRQVQGTINGLGERCGNANLVALIPTLMLKLGYETGVGQAGLAQLTHVSRLVDERLNRAPNRHAAYVGENAFAHKAGLHVSAIEKDPATYEHIPPETVGNHRKILMSDQAGRANVLNRLADAGIQVAADDQRVAALVEQVKQKEFEGYAYDAAAASFELLARLAMEDRSPFFRVEKFRVMDERRWNAVGKLTTISEATIRVEVGGQSVLTVAEGNGPVNALDAALRQALAGVYPNLADVTLVDYRVRILTANAGTEAVTRVIIDSRDRVTGATWSTVGVSTNVIDASFNALYDALCYKLLSDEVRG